MKIKDVIHVLDKALICSSFLFLRRDSPMGKKITFHVRVQGKLPVVVSFVFISNNFSKSLYTAVVQLFLALCFIGL